MKLLQVNHKALYIFEDPSRSTKYDPVPLKVGEILVPFYFMVPKHKVHDFPEGDYLSRYEWYFVMSSSGRIGWVSSTAKLGGGALFVREFQ